MHLVDGVRQVSEFVLAGDLDLFSRQIARGDRLGLVEYGDSSLRNLAAQKEC